MEPNWTEEYEVKTCRDGDREWQSLGEFVGNTDQDTIVDRAVYMIKEGRGPTGRGSRGSKGPRGLRGLRGSRGLKGPRGSKGARGPQNEFLSRSSRTFF